MAKRIIEVSTLSIIGFLGTLVLPIVLNYFFENDSRITIGKTIKLDEHSYALSINVVTQRHSLNDLKVLVPGKIDSKQFKFSMPLKVMSSYTPYSESSLLTIEDIPANQRLQLIVETVNELKPSDIEFIAEHIRINLLSELKNPANEGIKILILSAAAYTLLIGISSYYLLKDRDIRDIRRRNEVNELQNEIKKIQKEAKEEYDGIRVKIIKDHKENLKRQLLLKAKLHDYRKELEFWKNTIKKILYNNIKKDNQAEELLSVVTKELKTYGTFEYKHDYEHLKILAEIIKEDESDDKNE